MSGPPNRALRRQLLLQLGAGAAALSGMPAARGVDRPDWPALELIDGARLEPSALANRALVLVIWATYCPFCRRHNALLERLYRSLAGSPPLLVTAATDRDESVVRRYMTEHGFSFPVTLQAEPLRQRLDLRRVIPMTCTFDSAGRLRQRIPGEMSEDDVMALARLADA